MKQLLAFIIALCAFPAVAQSDFDRAIDAMLRTCPDLRALPLSQRQILSNLAAENNLPEAELEGAFLYGSHHGSAESETKTELSLSQAFEWPGVYAARNHQISLTRSALDLGTIAAIAEARLRASELLIDVAAAHKVVDIAQATCSLMTDLSRHYNTAFNHGEVSIIDRDKVDIERLRALHRLEEAQIALENAVSSAALFAGSDNLAPMLHNIHEFPLQPLLSEDEYEKILADNDPEATRLSLLAEADGAARTAARRSSLPGFSLGYRFTREGGLNFNGVGIGISLPFLSNRHKTASAEATLALDRLNVETLRLSRLNEMRTDRTNALKSARMEQDYARVLDSGRQTELLRKAFEGGQISLFNYLADIVYFSEAHIDRIECNRQLAHCLARLNRFNNINIQ